MNLPLRHKIAVAAALAGVATIAGGVAVRSYSEPVPARVFIEHAFIRCLNGETGEQTIRACLNARVAELLHTYSAMQIMDTLVADDTPTELSSNCHIVAHAVGKQSYIRAGDIEEALRACTSQCSEGCLHGAVGEAVLQELGQSYSEEDIAHLETSEIERLGKKYCDASPGLCHGIGHLLYISSRDYKIAVRSCEKIADEATSEKCFRGVFMEGIGGQATLFGSVPEPQAALAEIAYSSPCKTAPPISQHACFSYLPYFQNRIFFAQGIHDPSTRLMIRQKTCLALDVRARSDCFGGIGYSSHARENIPSDTLEETAFCETLPDQTDRMSCHLGEVAALVKYYQYDDALALCSAINQEHEKRTCFDGIFTIMQDTPNLLNENDIHAVCEQSNLSQQCAEQFASFIAAQASLPDYRFGLFGRIGG